MVFLDLVGNQSRRTIPPDIQNGREYNRKPLHYHIIKKRDLMMKFIYGCNSVIGYFLFSFLLLDFSPGNLIDPDHCAAVTNM